MSRESTKEKRVRLEATIGTLQFDLESLAKNTEINSIKIASTVYRMFVNTFTEKLNKVIRDVTILAEVQKSNT